MKRWMRGAAWLASASGAVALLPAAAHGQVPTTAEYMSTDFPNTWVRVGGTGDAVIAQGGTVTWTVPAGGSPNHNLDFTGTTDPSCLLDGALTSLPTPLGRGWTAVCTFAQPGQYPFICVPHQNGMRGTVTVQAPPPPPPPGDPQPPAPGTPQPPPQPGGGTPPPGTTAPGLAAARLTLAKRQVGARLRGSLDVRQAGSRVRVDALVRRALLGQKRRSGRVRVGRVVRSSVGPGRVAFSLRLQPAARKALRARGRLAVRVRTTVTAPGATTRVWTRAVTLVAR